MMKKEGHVTIKDVAKAANVSVATVSRILGGSSDFSPETKKLVWETAHSLHYSPNPQARMLRKKKAASSQRIPTNLIMLVSHMGNQSPFGYPVSAEYMQMFSWFAQEKGLFSTFYRYNEKTGFCCPPLLDHLIDGVVVGCPHKEVIQTLRKKVPLVALDVNNCCRDPEILMVNPALETGFIKLLEEARALGHRSIALAGGINSENLYAGNYCKLLARLLPEENFLLPPEYIFQVEAIPENHEEKMEEVASALLDLIRERKITLIVAADMCYAKSIYDFLLKKGFRIPEEVSLISFNSTRDLGTLPCGITNIGHDWEGMMKTALDVLTRRMNGEKLLCSEYLVNTIYDPGKTLGMAPMLQKQ